MKRRILFCLSLCLWAFSNMVVWALPPLALEDIQSRSSSKSGEELVKELPATAKTSDPFLILVNEDHAIAHDFHPDLAYTDNSKPYDARVQEDFNRLLAAAAKEGIYLMVVSAYRTPQEQADNRMQTLNGHLANGLSQIEADRLTNQFLAPANRSEHSTALAFDIIDTSWTAGLTQDYAYTESGRWLANNAHYYGFILRYDEGKTDITGYEFEPWHYRYVGEDHARFMKAHDLTLEEYLVLVEAKEIATP